MEVNNLVEYTLKTFSSIFIIMGPFSVIPIFISLTQNNTVQERNRIINKSIVATFLICALFAITGVYLFNIFGITINSFRVAGGLLLLLMSINMLQAKRSPVRTTSAEVNEGIEKEDVSVFPLAIPMISGPGTLSTVVLLAGEATTVAHWAILFVSLLVSVVLMFLILKLSDRVYTLLGTTGLNIMTRIMGLILASMSVEFIMAGVKGYFKI